MKKRVWKKVTKVQYVYLLLALSFLVSAHILTWYGVKFLGLEEGNPSLARLIQMYGAPQGLVLNLLIWLALILPTWFVWVRFPIPCGRKWLVVNLIFTFILTYTFMWLLWSVVFDFVNDAVMVAFGSKIFFSLLRGTAFSVFTLAIFASISAAIYLKFHCGLERLGLRRRKLGP